MNKNILNNIRAWFHCYVDKFRNDAGDLNYLLQLKLDHSMRVAQDCRFIANGLGWPESDVNTAEAIGILHDTGRFSQFLEFGTFHDPDSINHGKRGYEIIQSCDCLESCETTLRDTILDSIRFHNCRDIPKGLTCDSEQHLKLIRDADKIDIIYIVNHAITNNLHDKYPQIMLNINLDGPLTPELLHEIKTTDTGTYTNVHTLADLNLMRLTWISNINYTPSLKLFAERRLMEELVERIPSDPDALEVTSRFINQLHQRLAEAEVTNE